MLEPKWVSEGPGPYRHSDVKSTKFERVVFKNVQKALKELDPSGERYIVAHNRALPSGKRPDVTVWDKQTKTYLAIFDAKHYTTGSIGVDQIEKSLGYGKETKAAVNVMYTLANSRFTKDAEELISKSDLIIIRQSTSPPKQIAEILRKAVAYVEGHKSDGYDEVSDSGYGGEESDFEASEARKSKIFKKYDDHKNGNEHSDQDEEEYESTSGDEFESNSEEDEESESNSEEDEESESSSEEDEESESSSEEESDKEKNGFNYKDVSNMPAQKGKSSSTDKEWEKVNGKERIPHQDNKDKMKATTPVKSMPKTTIAPEPHLKNNLPDKNYKEIKKTGSSKSGNSAGPLRKDGYPDRRFKENKNLPSLPSSEKHLSSGPIRKDGNPDMRFSVNKIANNKNSSVDNSGSPMLVLRKDGQPDMRYKANKDAAKSLQSKAASSKSTFRTENAPGRLRHDGQPDMRYKANW